MSSLPTARASEPVKTFRHEAFLYAGDEQFVGGTVAFARGALEAGEAVLVAVTEPRAALLREALGRDAEHIDFLDLARVGRNPARILPAWQDWVDRQAPTARGFRGIGEPIWPGRTPAEIVECQYLEQLLNIAFDGGPGWWLLCPYDRAALPAAVVERAYSSHPGVFEGDRHRHSAGYGDAAALGFSAIFSEPLEEPAGPLVEVGFDLADLADVRDLVERYAEPVVGSRAMHDAVLVVAELAANSIKYGGGGGTLRLWSEGTAVVCEVRDDGVITDPLIGRRRPSLTARGKAGLWIVNQVCDLLQIRSGAGRGTVVRARLGAGDAAA